VHVKRVQPLHMLLYLLGLRVGGGVCSGWMTVIEWGPPLGTQSPRERDCERERRPVSAARKPKMRECVRERGGLGSGRSR
jgi:hypothetical protein